MKRRLVSLVLALIFALGLSTTANAYTDKQMRAADALNHLSLFLGVSSKPRDYALDESLERCEGVTLLLRIIGREDEALMLDKSENIFSDMGSRSWAIPYVTYGAQIGLVKGVGTSKETGLPLFQPAAAMTDYMYLTLVLRQLGYRDTEGEFVWNKPYALAKSLGLIDSTVPDTEFTRGDAALVSWKAMSVQYKGTNQTVADRLITEGIFTAVEYQEAKEIWSYGYVLGGGISSGDSGNNESGNPGTTPDINNPGNDQLIPPSVGEDDMGWG